MHNHVTPHDLAFISVAIAGLLFLSWFFAGRRVFGPPASSVLPQTFIASRLLPTIFCLFAVVGLVLSGLISLSALFFMTDEQAGSHAFRLSAGLFLFVAAVFCAYGMKALVIWAIWPDHLTLTEEGIDARLQGRERHWIWDMIADVRVRWVGRDQQMLDLILKEPDPIESRRMARLPWATKADPRIVWLGDMWKATALLKTGDDAVCDAIRAILAKRGQIQAP